MDYVPWFRGCYGVYATQGIFGKILESSTMLKTYKYECHHKKKHKRTEEGINELKNTEYISKNRPIAINCSKTKKVIPKLKP